MRFVLLILLSTNLYSQDHKFLDCIKPDRSFTYGHNPKAHEKDCVMYLHSLLVGYDKSLKNDKSFKDEVYIINKTNRSIKQLLLSNSPIPKGACEALVKRGKANYTKKPVRGDIFQFWIIMNGWKPSGHCGIIKEVLGNNKYLIISSYNESGCNGYCESIMDIKDIQISYIWFVHLK